MDSPRDATVRLFPYSDGSGHAIEITAGFDDTDQPSVSIKDAAGQVSFTADQWKTIRYVIEDALNFITKDESK